MQYTYQKTNIKKKKRNLQIKLDHLTYKKIKLKLMN